MFGKTYNNCVKKEEVTNEAAAWTEKLERTKRVDSTKREGSRMNARTRKRCWSTFKKSWEPS